MAVDLFPADLKHLTVLFDELFVVAEGVQGRQGVLLVAPTRLPPGGGMGLGVRVDLHADLDEFVAQLMAERGDAGEGVGVVMTDFRHGWPCIGRDIIMNDLQQGLVGGQGKKQTQLQKRRYEECELKIKTLRNKNNELQKQTDNELESDIRMAIRSQTSIIENEIKSLRDLLEALNRDFKDPSSKRKIKDLCNLASKQMERNGRIMAEFVNRASSSASYLKRESSALPFRRSRTEMDRDLLSPIKEGHLQPVNENRGSLIASEDMMSDLKYEQQMVAERTALLKELESKNNKINQIINQMGSIVGGEQQDMVNALDDNMKEVKHNTGQANEELDQAIVLQKKSKRKYVWIVTTIIILVLIIGGMVYFLVN